MYVWRAQRSEVYLLQPLSAATTAYHGLLIDPLQCYLEGISYDTAKRENAPVHQVRQLSLVTTY